MIAIPILAGICFYVYSYRILNPSPTYPNTNLITEIFHRASQACYFIIIVYGLYPIVFTAERIKNNNYETIANDFEFIKKSLFIGLPILVIVIIIIELPRYFQIIMPPILYGASVAILVASIAAVIGPFLRTVAYTVRREFRFYLARGYIRISSAKQNNFDKIKYLFLSLDSYNKFLVRKTKFGIKNIDKIYSDIMHNDATKNDELIKSINERLGGQGMKLGIYLSKIYKVTDTEQFFIKEALVQKVKGSCYFFSGSNPISCLHTNLFEKFIAVNSNSQCHDGPCLQLLRTYHLKSKLKFALTARDEKGAISNSPIVTIKVEATPDWYDMPERI